MKTCENCMNCVYVEQGDMYCDLTLSPINKNVKWVYDEFCPTKDYMWCNGKEYEER